MQTLTQLLIGKIEVSYNLNPAQEIMELCPQPWTRRDVKSVSGKHLGWQVVADNGAIVSYVPNVPDTWVWDEAIAAHPAALAGQAARA